jgi:hypothetical protein
MCARSTVLILRLRRSIGLNKNVLLATNATQAAALQVRFFLKMSYKPIVLAHRALPIKCAPILINSTLDITQEPMPSYALTVKLLFHHAHHNHLLNRNNAKAVSCKMLLAVFAFLLILRHRGTTAFKLIIHFATAWLIPTVLRAHQKSATLLKYNHGSSRYKSSLAQ